MTKITNNKIIKFVKDNLTALKICLYSKDLDFEFPHVLYQNKVRSQILEELDEEEKNLKLMDEIAEEAKLKNDKKEEIKRQTYENYYSINKNCKDFITLTS